jgi:release factor H-coupled RctB family protein
LDNSVFTTLTDDGKVHLLASKNNWIEGEAVSQLRKTAELPGMRLAVGLPDLHPGRGHPVGAAFITEGVFYPQLVGNDVGCGMGFWQSDLKRQKFKQDKYVKRLDGLESPWDGDAAGWLAHYGVASTESDAALGTIGGGNHFAEVQDWHEIHDQAAFSDLGLQKQSMMILVHSGSRGWGEFLLRSHLDKHGAEGLKEGSDDAMQYLQRHEHARQWAVANRALIASRMAEQLHCAVQKVLDISHNSITAVEYAGQSCWLHRKGAAPADRVPRPGAEVVRSVGIQACNHLAERLAGRHGACPIGRRMNVAGFPVLELILTGLAAIDDQGPPQPGRGRTDLRHSLCLHGRGRDFRHGREAHRIPPRGFRRRYS